jgi:hypothetical protein
VFTLVICPGQPSLWQEVKAENITIPKATSKTVFLLKILLQFIAVIL